MPFFYDLDRTDPLQRRIAARLLALSDRLDAEIPARTLDDTLLLATWNIREFDSPAYGLRGMEPYHYIAEIISRFDLVALQEVRRDTAPLDRLCGLLGPWWKYLVTDVTEGTRGNKERMAFLYDSRKVEFGGLAGEGVEFGSLCGSGAGVGALAVGAGVGSPAAAGVGLMPRVKAVVTRATVGLIRTFESSWLGSCPAIGPSEEEWSNEFQVTIAQRLTSPSPAARASPEGPLRSSRARAAATARALG